MNEGVTCAVEVMFEIHIYVTEQFLSTGQGYMPQSSHPIALWCTFSTKQSECPAKKMREREILKKSI